MKKLLIFNWKMNPDSFGKAKRLFGEFLKISAKGGKSLKLKTELVVVPPFIYLSKLAGIINKTKVKLGAQDLFSDEISGVEYVIIGHSDRRRIMGETDEIINKKVLAALKTGLKVILCVGESKRRGKGKEEREKMAKNYVKKQLEKNLKRLSSIHFPLSSLIVAYEPVWAISTSKKGRSDTPEDAIEIIKFIKQVLKAKSYKLKAVKVLYGGSVDSKNIAKFLKHPEIDGALIGHASLKVGEVGKIIEIMGGLK